MNERLTVQALTDLLAARHGMTKKDAEAFVKEFFLLIRETLEHENCVKIKGLGTFKLIDVDSRESVNVNTGERFQIEGHTKVSFVPDSNLRDTINKPFAHFETVVLNDTTILEDTPINEVEEGEGEETSTETLADEVVVAPEPISQELPLVEEPAVEEPKIEDSILEEQEILCTEIEEPLEIQPKRVEESSDVIVPEKGKSPIPYLITIILIVVLLCGSAILFIYYPDLLSTSSNKTTLDMPVATQPVAEPIQPEVLLADTIRKDTIKMKEEIVAVPDIPKEIVKEQVSVPIYSDSATYIIIGTKAIHKIREGETLTKVALHYYGSKGMWPYIVKHNPKAINNPNSVPYGTTIQIPELTKK